MKPMNILLIAMLFAAIPSRAVESNKGVERTARVTPAKTSKAPFPRMLQGCPGEGCGCTNAKSVREDAVLHEKMDTASKIVARLKRGDSAEAAESYTIVSKPGRVKVTRVHDPKLGISVGEELQLIMYVGEGYTIIWKAGKPLPGKDEQQGIRNGGEISWKELSEPERAEWHKMRSKRASGFSETFPFEGCLE